MRLEDRLGQYAAFRPGGKVVIVAIDDIQFRVLHDGTQLSAHPRTFIKEVTRGSASGHPTYQI